MRESTSQRRNQNHLEKTNNEQATGLQPIVFQVPGLPAVDPPTAGPAVIKTVSFGNQNGTVLMTAPEVKK